MISRAVSSTLLIRSTLVVGLFGLFLAASLPLAEPVLAAKSTEGAGSSASTASTSSSAATKGVPKTAAPASTTAAPAEKKAPEAITDSARFEQDTLTIRTNKVYARPKWETWSSETPEGKPSQMIVVDFPNLGTGQKALKDALTRDFSAIQEKNPSVLRLLALPLGTDTLRVVFEVLQTTAQPLSTRVNQVAGQEVTIRLHGGTASSVETPVKPSPTDKTAEKPASKPQSSAQKPEETTASQPNPTYNALKQQEAQNAKFKQQIAELTAENARLQEQLKKQQEQLAKQQTAFDRKAASEQSMAMFQELQKTVQARDALQAQIAHQEARIASLEAEKKALKSQLTEQKDYISMAEDSNLSPTEQIANLRLAVVNVSKKLKDAEAIIETQKTQIAKLQGLSASAPSQPQTASQTSRPEASQSLAKPDNASGSQTQAKSTASTADANQSTAKKSPEKKPSQQVSELPEKIYFKPNTDKEKQALLNQIQQTPKQTSSYLKLASLYIQDQNYAEAEHVVNNLLQVDPKNGEGYYELTRIYLLQREPLKARAVFETFKRLNPSLPASHPLYQKIESQLKAQAG